MGIIKMRGVNLVVLVGTLGANPESKSFPNGGSLCNFSIATSEKWQSKQTGEWIEQTEWHRIVIKNRLGANRSAVLKKRFKSLYRRQTSYTLMDRSKWPRTLHHRNSC